MIKKDENIIVNNIKKECVLFGVFFNFLLEGVIDKVSVKNFIFFDMFLSMDKI